MSAHEAADAIAAGFATAMPEARVLVTPVSDGGPGFVDVLAETLAGERIEVATRDPLLRPRTGTILRCGSSVYVETADSLGLHLLSSEERDPLQASSAGVADLLRAALDLAPAEVVLGLGGSATNDGGSGMLHAFGFSLLDAAGVPIDLSPAALSCLAHVRRPSPPPTEAALVAAVDVDNPLLGPEGASLVFAGQKGADSAAVTVLEELLGRFVTVVSADLPETEGFERRGGAGAAGGLGYGLSLLGASTRAGTEVVFEALSLEERIRHSDLVVTGEGSFDAQSLRGKATAGVARLCRSVGVPCLVLAGRVALEPADYEAVGVAAAFSLEEKAGSLDAAREGGRVLLEQLSLEVGRREAFSSPCRGDDR